MATPAVGCRVRILKDYATVRYLGPVVNQEGTWVGVEWDDPSRGKHDGSTGGVRYFECKSGTNSGSFVRIERVCFGVSVLDALRARYNNETAEHGEDVAADELYVHTSRKRRVQVQMVGEEKIQQKQRQIHALDSARLVGLDVSAVGDPAPLRSSVPRLASLDLTCNLVAHWGFAEQLAGALPGVALLNLSENRMELPLRAPSPPRPPLSGIRVLVLNDCGITWRQVLAVAPQLPSLEELHLCGNPIGSLQPAAGPEAAVATTTTTSTGDAPATSSGPQQPGSRGAAAGGEEASTTTTEAAVALEGAGAPGAMAGSGSAEQEERGRSEQAAASTEAGTVGGGGTSEVEEDETAAELLASLFPRLQVLTLEEAQLPGWATLELLRRLPALARLHLAGNPAITHIRYPASRQQQQQPGAKPGAEPVAPAPASAPDSTAQCPSAATGEGDTTSSSGVAAPPPAPSLPLPFPRLTALFLGGCGVGSWCSVNQLELFPALRELRLTGNPVLGLSKTGGRFEVIGRVSRLTLLNGAEVRPRERRDSELRYLQHIAAEMEAAGQDEARRAAVRSAHPRLRQLMELHGTVLATAARGASSGGSLASSMVELKLTCVAAAAHAKMGTQVKKLPRSTTVSALRLLCERLFKVRSERLALFLRAPGDPLPESLGGGDDEDRQLGFFGVQDGYEVLVDEADPEESRRADEDARVAAAAAHEQRLAEQLRAAEKLQAEFARSMGLQQQQQQQQQP